MPITNLPTIGTEAPFFGFVVLHAQNVSDNSDDYKFYCACVNILHIATVCEDFPTHIYNGHIGPGKFVDQYTYKFDLS